MVDDIHDRLIVEVDGRKIDLLHEIAKTADAALELLIDELKIPVGDGSRGTLRAVHNYLIHRHSYPPWQVEGMELREVVQVLERIARQQRDTAPRMREATLQKQPTDTDHHIINAMQELGAVESDHRKSAREIARKAIGGTANSIKHSMVELKGRGLVDSIGGRRGGYWLTSAGLEMVRTEAHRL